eukprot:3031537-Amphidinium_carterae.1
MVVAGLSIVLRQGSAGVYADSTVQWTSVRLTLQSHGVIVEIKPQLLCEIQALLHILMSSNVVPVRSLRKLTGKLSH